MNREQYGQFGDSSLPYISSAKSAGLFAPQNEERRSLVPVFGNWGRSTAEDAASSSASTMSTAPTMSAYSSPVLGDFVNAKSAGADGSSGVSGMARAGLSFVKSGIESVRDGASRVLSGTQEAAQMSVDHYLYFGVSAAAGLLLMGLALLYLPIIVFAPQKFALLFTLGSVLLINSIAMLRGYGALLHHLLEKDRLPLSLGYALSLVGTLYVTLSLRSYILSILFAIGQIGCLVALLLSYFAGASRVISLLKSFVYNAVSRLMGGPAAGQSFLPI